jgi:hypothetical protein
MEPTDETIIELSRMKLVLTFLGSCAFVAAGAWMLSVDAAEIRSGRSFNFFFREPWVVYGFGLAAVLFFGATALYASVKLLDKRPGLVLNSSGFVDNASGVAAGFVPWSEVLGAGTYEVQGQKMLIIGLRDPQKYVDRGNAVKRLLNKGSYKMTGSPVAVSSAALRIDFKELVSLFERYHRKYGVDAARRET